LEADDAQPGAGEHCRSLRARRADAHEYDVRVVRRRRRAALGVVAGDVLRLAQSTAERAPNVLEGTDLAALGDRLGREVLLGGVQRDGRHQRSAAFSPLSSDSASASAGMLSASPGTVTAQAPQAFPSARQPAESQPRRRPERKPATNASPAPTVSTTRTSWPR